MTGGSGEKRSKGRDDRGNVRREEAEEDGQERLRLAQRVCQDVANRLDGMRDEWVERLMMQAQGGDGKNGGKDGSRGAGGGAGSESGEERGVTIAIGGNGKKRKSGLELRLELAREREMLVREAAHLRKLAVLLSAGTGEGGGGDVGFGDDGRGEGRSGEDGAGAGGSGAGGGGEVGGGAGREAEVDWEKVVEYALSRLERGFYRTRLVANSLPGEAKALAARKSELQTTFLSLFGVGCLGFFLILAFVVRTSMKASKASAAERDKLMEEFYQDAKRGGWDRVGSEAGGDGEGGGSGESGAEGGQGVGGDGGKAEGEEDIVRRTSFDADRSAKGWRMGAQVAVLAGVVLFTIISVIVLVANLVWQI